MDRAKIVNSHGKVLSFQVYLFCPPEINPTPTDPSTLTKEVISNDQNH
jgi:hypothetical protein